MTIDVDRLATVANYAKLRDVTVTAVYRWIEQGKERSIKIDGVQFVFMSIEDAKEYKRVNN